MPQREALFRERSDFQQHVHQAPAEEGDDDILNGVLRRVAVQHCVSQRSEEDERVKAGRRGGSQQK